jgi:kynurenine formamidase
MVFHGLTITHLDALSHSFSRGQVYGGRNQNVVTAELGATALSVDAIKDGIFTRGVLLDIARSKDLAYLEPGYPISVGDLEAAEDAQGVKARVGDALLIHTGWWSQRIEHGPDKERKRPGLHASTLPWLHKRGVSVLVTDAANDVVPSGYENIELPIHEIGQVAMGLCIIDACYLEPLADKCSARSRWDFLFVVSPLRIQYGTGSPVNPLAIL